MKTQIRPPFTKETALAKVKASEDAWNIHKPIICFLSPFAF